MSPRLKSLELHGYKTFASRTDFQFPGVITAIVGPNGSGKSNIADALRWVLGEQSFSLLRGRKTEDMIFAGSEQRPKAGMASATITFDNSDGWLPIDYSEVAIARRAYRDGQNEYLLNGQRIRLKDVSELLAESGLAERTYTIIGQGLVDAALSLKPEERRRFFEEAAGIGLYRTRKEEALNRLEATRRNLERVYDILSELEPRLTSLEKQARRAQEYDQIKADLRLLLREWYGFHWHKTISDVAHQQELTRIQEDRLQQAREKLSEITNHLEAHRKRLGIQRDQLNERHSLLAHKHQEREKVSKSLAVLDERQRALNAQYQSLSEEYLHLQEEQAGRLLNLADLEKEIDQLSAELLDSEGQAKTAKSMLIEQREKRDKLDQLISGERKKLAELDLRAVQLTARREELQNRVETLKLAQQSLQAQDASAEDTLQNCAAVLERTRLTSAEQETHVHQVEQSIQVQQKEIQKKENQRVALLRQINSCAAEVTKAQAQHEVLTQAQASSAGLNQGAKLVLDNASSGKLTGRFQAFSAMLDVPKEYTAAISALLGEFLDGIIFSSESDIDQVLDLLAAGDHGRALLLPDALNMEDTEPLLSDNDIIGKAVDLVSAPDRFKAVVNHLLGDAMVVRDRQAARRLVKKLPSHYRTVTLKGEVFWGSGAVSAGQEVRSGLIARPRQIKELEEDITRLKKQAEQLDLKRESLDREIAAQKEKVAGDEVEQRNARIEANRFSRMVQQRELEAQQAQQQRNWVRDQIANHDEQMSETLEEIGRILVEVEKIKEDRQTVDQEVRELSKHLTEFSLEDLQRQSAHWETSTAVVSRAVKELERRSEDLRQSLRISTEREDYFKNRLEATAAQQSLAEEEKKTLVSQENEITAVIDQLQNEILPDEINLQRMEKEYVALQGDHTAAQQAGLLADRLAIQTQLDLARIRDQLNGLRRRIEEDFGLVAFNFSTDVSGQTPLPFEGMVEQLPHVANLPQDFEDNINRQRSLLRRLGAVNPEAQNEYKEVRERYEFLKIQVEDLKKADADLRQVIVELDELMKTEFLKTFDAVAVEFRKNFTRLFGGGSAQLYLMDEEHPAEGGVDIEARLPGRREQGLSLLSGGERSLTAVALIFSLLRVSPTPFCVLDEVDAMLDEANVARFRELLLELSQDTQFIIITHNRNTVQAADVIYGVTMGRDSASQVISLKLDEVGEDYAK